jgi:predicted RNA binding protein YcfA (HicA-like mRNA interferase family)
MLPFAMKARDVIKLLEDDGWVHVRTRGSHRHYKHPVKPRLVTVAGHLNVDVPAGTLKNILRQAELENL